MNSSKSISLFILNPAAVILAHPHPGGVAGPSQADELITNRSNEALGLIDVRILDHIIVAGGDTASFAERGGSSSGREVSHRGGCETSAAGKLYLNDTKSNSARRSSTTSPF